MCEVPNTFSRALVEMTSLRTLSIWPDTFSERVRKYQLSNFSISFCRFEFLINC